MLKHLVLTAALASVSTAGIASEPGAAGETKAGHHHKKGEKKAKFHKKMAEHHKKMAEHHDKMHQLGKDAAEDKVDHKGFFKKFADLHKEKAELHTKKSEEKEEKADTE